jgi:hypothetical protein
MDIAKKTADRSFVLLAGAGCRLGTKFSEPSEARSLAPSAKMLRGAERREGEALT